MARTDNFINWATDIADSIREKTGKTDKIPASEFDTEIKSIQSDTSVDGGDSSLNIFVQEEEPTTYDGIWLQTSELNYDDVDIVNEITTVGKNITWSTGVSYPETVRESATTKIGTDIYIAGGQKSSSTTDCSSSLYKFDTVNNIYTKLSDIPYSAYGMSINAYGTDIYIFGGRNGSTVYDYAYKYDTLTDNYTQLTNIPYGVGQMGSTIVGSDIYLIGGTVGSSRTKNFYKYNILTDTYTQLTNLSEVLNTPGVATIETDIYFFGGYAGNGSSRGAYKYNTLTNTLTTLTRVPYASYGHGTIAYGTDIYIFGGIHSSGSFDYVYRYDTLTDSYTQLTNMPNAIGRIITNNTIVGNKFYVFGGTPASSTYTTDVVMIGEFNYNLSDKNGKILIAVQSDGYKTKLINIDNKLINCYVTAVAYNSIDNNMDLTIPTYYGDGTNWIAME